MNFFIDVLVMRFLVIYLFFSLSLSLSIGWSRLQQSISEPLQGVPALETSPICCPNSRGGAEDRIWSPSIEWRRITGISVGILADKAKYLERIKINCIKYLLLLFLKEMFKG